MNFAQAITRSDFSITRDTADIPAKMLTAGGNLIEIPTAFTYRGLNVTKTWRLYMRKYLTFLPLLAAGLLVALGPAAFAGTRTAHKMIGIARQAQAEPARDGDHWIELRIRELLHTVGFVRATDSLDVRPTTASYIDLLDVRTYAHAYGCHDLQWMRDYLAQGLKGTGAIHSRGGLAWRWQGGGEEVVLAFNQDHCRWGHPGGRLSARVWIVRFIPPDGR